MLLLVANHGKTPSGNQSSDGDASAAARVGQVGRLLAIFFARSHVLPIDAHVAILIGDVAPVVIRNRLARSSVVTRDGTKY